MIQYGDQTPKSIQLFSADGCLVKSLRPDGPRQTEVFVNDLPIGLYTVQMQNETGIQSVKISVIR